jgi:hypothetical protein
MRITINYLIVENIPLADVSISKDGTVVLLGLKADSKELRNLANIFNNIADELDAAQEVTLPDHNC